MSICILNVNPTTVSSRYADSLVGTVGMWHDLIMEHSTVNICYARNKVVQRFLETDHDSALMIDSDTVFNVIDITGVITEHTICSGIVEIPNRGHVGLFKESDVLWLDYPSDEIVEAHATGLAFVLIHRSVFEDVAKLVDEPYPWFREEVGDHGGWRGEDLRFYRLAREAGHPLHVNTAVRPGHQKGRIVHYPRS